MRRRPFSKIAILLGVLSLASGKARAFELTRLVPDAPPLRLDITASTTFAWHADNRNATDWDDHYSDLTNRINFQLFYGDWNAGLRLDTSNYFASPSPPGMMDGHYYVNELKVGKFYAGYTAPNFELTLGDTYVSFGRGLVLSMRKQPEIGTDTTLRGAKAKVRSPDGWGSLTAVAGAANPMTVDPATGASLATIPNPDWTPGSRVLQYQRMMGTDWIFGGRAEALVSSFTLAGQAARLTRDRITTLTGITPGPRQFADTTLGSLSLETPISDFGSFYLEAALQDFSGAIPNQRALPRGTAIYSSLSAMSGPWGAQAEFQSYRDYYGLYPSVTQTEFAGMRYTNVPTTEDLTNDSRGGDFNLSVTGGHLRVDRQVDGGSSLFVNYGFWATWAENGDARDNVHDLSLGGTWKFDDGYAMLSTGFRHDGFYGGARDGDLFYREYWLRENFEKKLTGPWSLDLVGRQRYILKDGYNMTTPSDSSVQPVAEPWNEGEIYLSLRYSPMLTGTLGFEYSTRSDFSPTYFNGTLKWEYVTGSTVQLFGGQQRGSIKCVGGMCRQFPDFTGVKLEWVQRY